MSPRPGVVHVVTAFAWRFAIVLAAAAALFVAATVSPMKTTRGGTTTNAVPSTSPDQTADVPALHSPTSFAAIAERPLFYPSRMPWAPPAPPEPPPVSTAPSPLTNYALVGVVVSGETRSALIRPPGATKAITLAEGQELGGWTLQEITRTRLRFAAGDASYDMTFPKPSESQR